MGYKCEACKKNTALAPDTLCPKCQAKGYFYRWGTVMRDKRVGRTKKAQKENLKKLLKGKGLFGGIEEGYIKKYGALEY